MCERREVLEPQQRAVVGGSGVVLPLQPAVVQVVLPPRRAAATATTTALGAAPYFALWGRAPPILYANVCVFIYNYPALYFAGQSMYLYYFPSVLLLLINIGANELYRFCELCISPTGTAHC